MISLRIAEGIEAMILDSFMFITYLVPASGVVVMTWKCMMAISLPAGIVGVISAFIWLLPWLCWIVGIILAPLPPYISTTVRFCAPVSATHARLLSFFLGSGTIVAFCTP